MHVLLFVWYAQAMVGFNVCDLGRGVICNTISGKLAFDARVGTAFGALMRRVAPVQLLPTHDMKARRLRLCSALLCVHSHLLSSLFTSVLVA
jgi:hypothetical protein